MWFWRYIIGLQSYCITVFEDSQNVKTDSQKKIESRFTFLGIRIPISNNYLSCLKKSVRMPTKNYELSAFPGTGSGAGDGLEDAIERGFAGKVRFHIYLGNLHVGLTAQQILGVSYAIGVDELRERAVAL